MKKEKNLEMSQMKLNKIEEEEDEENMYENNTLRYEDIIDNLRINEQNDNKKFDLDEVMMLESPFYEVSHYNLNNIGQSLKVKKTQLNISKSKFNIDESFLNEFSGSKKNFTEIQFQSFGMTILQFINCIMKSSLVQIAYCMKTLGLIYGSLAIIIIAYFSTVTLKLLMDTHKRTKIKNYLIFSDKVFGKFGKFIILSLNFGSAYGNCLTFIIIFSKVVPKILIISLGDISIPKFHLLLILGIILFVYCFKKDVSGIKKAAYYAFLGVIFFFILTIGDFFYSLKTKEILLKLEEMKNEEIFWGMEHNWYSKLTSISCIILSFSFHIFTFSIYGCMGEITIEEFIITANGTIFICAIIYLICGIIGFLLYYDSLYDSILDAIGNKFLNTLLSLSNCIFVIMTFPITFSALKNYWLLLIEVFLTKSRDFSFFIFRNLDCVKRKKNEIDSLKFKEANNFFGNQSSVIIPSTLEFIVVLLLYISVFYFASIITKLTFIFGIVGGIMGNCLSFIFPALFYLKIDNKERMLSKNNLISLFFVILGILLMFLCVSSTVIGQLKNK